MAGWLLELGCFMMRGCRVGRLLLVVVVSVVVSPLMPMGGMDGI